MFILPLVVQPMFTRTMDAICAVRFPVARAWNIFLYFCYACTHRLVIKRCLALRKTF